MGESHSRIRRSRSLGALQFHRRAICSGKWTSTCANSKATPLSPSNLTPEVESKIFKAFGEVHQLGLAHCDIRTQNILVSSADDDASVWIIDFEFARSG